MTQDMGTAKQNELLFAQIIELEADNVKLQTNLKSLQRPG